MNGVVNARMPTNVDPINPSAILFPELNCCVVVGGFGGVEFVVVAMEVQGDAVAVAVAVAVMAVAYW